MRNLLYSLAFVLVLLLAGSAGVRGVDGLDGVGEHTLWLPVVGKEAVPSSCYMGKFVVASRNLNEEQHYAGWKQIALSGDLDNIVATWVGIVATEPDFREDSIVVSDGWGPGEMGSPGGPGFLYDYWIARIPNDSYQTGIRYYSRIEYQCLGFHVHMESSAVAP